MEFFFGPKGLARSAKKESDPFFSNIANFVERCYLSLGDDDHEYDNAYDCILTAINEEHIENMKDAIVVHLEGEDDGYEVSYVKMIVVAYFKSYSTVYVFKVEKENVSITTLTTQYK